MLTLSSVSINAVASQRQVGIGTAHLECAERASRYSIACLSNRRLCQEQTRTAQSCRAVSGHFVALPAGVARTRRISSRQTFKVVAIRIPIIRSRAGAWSTTARAVSREGISWRHIRAWPAAILRAACRTTDTPTLVSQSVDLSLRCQRDGARPDAHNGHKSQTRAHRSSVALRGLWCRRGTCPRCPLVVQLARQ